MDTSKKSTSSDFKVSKNSEQLKQFSELLKNSSDQSLAGFARELFFNHSESNNAFECVLKHFPELS